MKEACSLPFCRWRFVQETYWRVKCQVMIHWQNTKGVSSSGKDVGKSYINFVRNSTEQLRQKVTDELWVLGFFEVFLVQVKSWKTKVLTLILFQTWYNAQMELVSNWLNERMETSLHIFQLCAISLIVKVWLHNSYPCFLQPVLLPKKLYNDFELQGIEEEKLNSRTFKTVMQRIQMEEATASVSNGFRDELEYVEHSLSVSHYILSFLVKSTAQNQSTDQRTPMPTHLFAMDRSRTVRMWWTVCKMPPPTWWDASVAWAEEWATWASVELPTNF